MNVPKNQRYSATDATSKNWKNCYKLLSTTFICEKHYEKINFLEMLRYLYGLKKEKYCLIVPPLYSCIRSEIPEPCKHNAFDADFRGTSKNSETSTHKSPSEYYYDIVLLGQNMVG